MPSNMHTASAVAPLRKKCPVSEASFGWPIIDFLQLRHRSSLQNMSVFYAGKTKGDEGPSVSNRQTAVMKYVPFIFRRLDQPPLLDRDEVAHHPQFQLFQFLEREQHLESPPLAAHSLPGLSP